MATFVGFLRAINLGATRKFAPAQIVAACESVGCTDVATHINTGNVRFTTSLRSRPKIESMLEQAFAADRGFEVATVVLTPAEITQIVADADDLGGADVDALTTQYVSVLKDEPSAAAGRRLEGESSSSEQAYVRGRAVHLLLATGYQSSKLATSVEKRLGVATNRNLTVLRAIAKKWC